MLTAIVLLLYGLSVAFDYLPNKKNRKPYVNVLYLTLLIISFVVLLLFTFHITLPGPSIPIKFVVDKIVGIFSK